MTATARYLMESELEAERLEGKTREEASIHQLKLVGVRPGMRVLDAGAGTGAVARAIARLVGEKGQVTALDLSPQRLAYGKERLPHLDEAQIGFVGGDLFQAPLKSGAFDLVWCRHVFQFLPNPAEALQHLIRLTRPGGKVVVGEVDGHGLFNDPCPPELQEGLDKLQRALASRFDPYAGRKLYHLFHQAGLNDLRVHLLPHHLYAGRASDIDLHNWEIKFQTIRPLGTLAFGGEAPYDSFVRNYLDFLAAPSTFTYSVLLLVEGVRPSRGS